MRTRPPEIYGIPISELARICHVSLKTASRWKAGSTCPPTSALLLLAGDLGCFDPDWSGWVIRRGVLISPEGWEIKVNEVLSVPLLRAQLVAYQSEDRKLQSIAEQPLPADFPEWVFEKQA